MSAENLSKLRVSYKKFYGIRKLVCKDFPQKFHYDMMMSYLAEILKFGDTQPALVYSEKPLVVSAYSDELDAVLFLSFPDELADKYELRRGDRLTTACTYVPFGYGEPAADIEPGENRSGQYLDFTPVVQLFYGAGDKKIRAKTELFPEPVWDRAAKLTEEHAGKGLPRRNGFYYMFKDDKDK